jgi:tetratricopeptide (TPR) repeat protein
LARLYYFTPDFNEDPEPLFMHSLRIKQKVIGENHPDTAESLYRLADFYRSRERYAEAEPLYESAISILDAQPESDEFHTRWMRSGYAEFLRETGREARATELELQWGEQSAFEDMCRNEVRNKEITYGPDAPELAESLEHLADACLFEEKYEEAEEHYLRALSIREKSLGPEHFTLASSLHGLARVYRMREQYPQAVELVQRAAGITLDHYGTESVEYARTQEHLASLKSAQEQYQQAEALYRQAVDTYGKAAGRDSRVYAEGLYHFAYFYAGTRQFEKADAMLQELTAISENDIGVAELEKADYYELYANVLRELGRTSEAEGFAKRVETIWAKSRETDD